MRRNLAIILTLLLLGLAVGMVLADDQDQITSRPWAGTVTGDAGPYTDAHWRTMYESMFYGGDNRGPLRNYWGEFLVQPTTPAAMTT